jgi:hypothetical protein
MQDARYAGLGGAQIRLNIERRSLAAASAQ